MSNRLSRIYTRGGDKGDTSLANGTRVSKSSLRIECLGTLDELNSSLGVIICHLAPEHPIRNILALCQHQLFDIGGELAMATAEYQVTGAEDVAQLEQQLDELNAELPPLKEFILPGGNASACYTHMARSICRRAERIFTALWQEEMDTLNPQSLAYLNRLSDLLFVSSRCLAREAGGNEVLWQPKKNRN